MISWVTGVLRRTFVFVQALKMASEQIVETSVAKNSVSQDSRHPGDHFQSSYVTPGHKHFSYKLYCETRTFIGVKPSSLALTKD